jgi:hypothetical protein
MGEGSVADTFRKFEDKLDFLILKDQYFHLGSIRMLLVNNSGLGQAEWLLDENPLL